MIPFVEARALAILVEEGAEDSGMSGRGHEESFWGAAGH